MKFAHGLSAAFALVLLAGSTALAQDVARKHGGVLREQLSQMEMKPFDAALLSTLPGWTNGSAPTSESLRGKVVVVVTWSSWYKVSHNALASAQQIQDRLGGQGVIVLGVHHQQGFEDAKSVAAAKGATFPFAHDEKGAFRSALKVDQDPEIFVIDRAGNLRYADVTNEAALGAAESLAKETTEQAAALPASIKDRAASAQAEASKARGVAGAMRPGTLLNVVFTPPAAEEYKATKWPETNSDTSGLNADDLQGKPLPQGAAAGKWITEAPNTSGRVVVFDFWATWCGPCKRAMPTLDDLQKKNRQDLVIVGMSGQPAGDYKEDFESVKKFLGTHKSEYAHANDLGQSLYKAFRINAIPHVVVVSTDNVVRWQGNPLDPKFRAAVENTLRVDPGVKARRAAEEAFLKKSEARAG